MLPQNDLNVIYNIQLDLFIFPTIRSAESLGLIFHIENFVVPVIGST